MVRGLLCDLTKNFSSLWIIHNRKTSEFSPTLSMRDLMAEAEAEAKKNGRRPIRTDKSVMKIHEEKLEKR